MERRRARFAAQQVALQWLRFCVKVELGLRPETLTDGLRRECDVAFIGRGKTGGGRGRTPKQQTRQQSSLSSSSSGACATGVSCRSPKVSGGGPAGGGLRETPTAGLGLNVSVGGPPGRALHLTY